MDETTYSDPQVIDMINDLFIPTRVNSDERPDVSSHYALGDWPTTSLLTPEGEPISGVTYVGPRFMRAYLSHWSEEYRKDKSVLLQKAREAQQASRESRVSQAGASRALIETVFDEVAGEVMREFDALDGGFGYEPKLLYTEVLELALAKYFGSRDEDYLQIVTLTLTKMARGSIQDHVAGGFFHNSITRDWTFSHFEKTLEDNARLLSVYLHAYQVSRRQIFRETACSIVDYTKNILFDHERGYFYGSQYADEEYDLMSVQERARLPEPHTDLNLYAAPNAFMASAYLEAAHVLDDAALQDLALRTLRVLEEDMFKSDGGMIHFRGKTGPVPGLSGLLNDQASCCSAFLDAYQATGQSIYLSRARAVADFALTRLLDKQNGAFTSDVVPEDEVVLLRILEKPLDENSMMAQALIRLFHFTGEDKYREAAEETLGFYVPEYKSYWLNAASYALAIDALLNHPLHIVVVGHAEAEETTNLWTAFRKQYAPVKVIELLDPRKDIERLIRLGLPLASTGPKAYISTRTGSLLPITEPHQIAEGIMSALRTDVNEAKS